MDILNYCKLVANGHRLIVPTAKDYKISKEGYSEFKQQMLNIKGRWEGNQTFSFPYNASEIIRKIAEGNSFDFRKLQLFPTPMFLAQNMWDYLCTEFRIPYYEKENVSQLRILEPSAGTGNLINFLHGKGASNIDYCELSDEYDYILHSNTEGIKLNKVGTDFLKLDGKDGYYDLVFANPPFSGDTKHLDKMYKVVKEGGFVCTLLGEGFYKKNSKDNFQSFIKKYSNSFFSTFDGRSDSKSKEDWVFDDTPSGYSLLVLQKPINEVAKKIIPVLKVASQPLLFDFD